MNFSELSTLPILSWIDVARRLSATPMRGSINKSTQYDPPMGLIASEVFWTGLTLTLEGPENIDDVNKWLQSIFGTWLIFNDGIPSIRLDGPSARSLLRVTYEFSGVSKSKSIFRPSASQQWYVQLLPLRCEMQQLWGMCSCVPGIQLSKVDFLQVMRLV